MGLKSTLRKFQLKKLINNPIKTKLYKGFDSIEWIGISYERSNSKDDILKYAARMKSAGKKVQLLEYIPFTQKEIEKKGIATEGLWFCKSDLSFSGNPNNANVEKFLKQGMDVYLDLNSKAQHPLDFISLKAKSSLKAGSSLKEDLSMDLMLSITENNNFEQLFKELDYYLNFINQKKN